jgi:hypothetical protein
VATFVLSLFIMLALGTIVPAYKVTREAEESLSSQREVVLAFDRLVAEMTLLDRASVSACTDTLAFLSDAEYRGSNPALADDSLDHLGVSTPERSWRKFVVLRHRGGQLWRREYPNSLGTELVQILADKLPGAGDAVGMQEKIYAKNVEVFEATPAGASRVLLKIRSVFREGAKPAACELNLQVQMRGGI